MTQDTMRLSFLKYKTKSLLRRNRSVRASLPYRQALNIGLIFTIDDKAKHAEVKDFIKKLQADGKRVTVITYLPKDKFNYEFMFDFFTSKEVSFWGKITSDIANRFADTEFDLLYYLDDEPNPLLLNLIAKSKARCRVGQFWLNREPFFEMMIENRAGIKGLIDAMYRYTHTLR